MIRTTMLMLLAMVIFGCNSPRQTGMDSDHLIYSAEDISWEDGPDSFEEGSQLAVLEGDPSEPGFFAVRFKLPDGFRIAPHWHPRRERVTVISGTLYLGMGEEFDLDAAEPLEQGSYFSLPPRSSHFAYAQGQTIIQLTSIGPWEINYINPEDDPRLRDD